MTYVSVLLDVIAIDVCVTLAIRSVTLAILSITFAMMSVTLAIMSVAVDSYG